MGWMYIQLQREGNKQDITRRIGMQAVGRKARPSVLLGCNASMTLQLLIATLRVNIREDFMVYYGTMILPMRGMKNISELTDCQLQMVKV